MYKSTELRGNLMFMLKFEDPEDYIPDVKKVRRAQNVKHAFDLVKQGYDFIDLSERPLKKQAVRNLCDLLTKFPRGIRKLLIDGCSIGEEGGIEVFKALLINNSVKVLQMDSNYLGSKTLLACADVLRNNKSLVHVNLATNKKVSSAPDDALSNILLVNQTLKSLILSGCNLREAMIINLVKGLVENRSLEFLGLNGNHNSVSVAKEIAHSLKANHTLTQLQLSGGKKKIKSKGLEYIAEALLSNSKLEKLWLDRNQFSGKSVATFANAMSIHPNLSIISLMGNKIGVNGFRALFSCVTVNTRIERIFHESIPDIVEKQLETNRSSRENAEKRRFDQILTTGNATGKMRRCRVFLAGDSQAGKTATARSLQGKQFDAEWKSTVAADLSEVSVSTKLGWSPHQAKYSLVKEFAASLVIEEQNTTVQNKGQTLQQSLVSRDNTESHVDEISIEKIEVENLKPSIGDGMGALPPPLISPKQPGPSPTEELKSDEMFLYEAKTYKDSFKFSLWDLGGQDIFHSMHHLFFTEASIYLFVFNLETFNQDKSSMMYWLNSILAHSPGACLLLAGTHLDSLKEDSMLRTINADIEELLAKYPFTVMQNGDLQFFPLSNLNGIGLSSLRKGIIDVVQSSKIANVKVPVNWIFCFEEALADSSSFHSLTNFYKIGARYRISAEECDKMLDYFHSLGIIFYLPFVEPIDNFVVTNPQWMITNIGKVIRDFKQQPHNLKDIKTAGLEIDYQNLLHSGILSRDLSRYFFAEGTWDATEFFWEVLRKSLLGCKWQWGEINKEALFLPSIVTPNFSSIPLVYDFGCRLQFSSLIRGILGKVVCLCSTLILDSSPSHKPTLAKNGVKLDLGQGFITLSQSSDESCLYLFTDDPGSASHSLHTIESILKKLTLDHFGNGFIWSKKYKQVVDGNIEWLEKDLLNEIVSNTWFNFAEEVPEGIVIDNLLELEG